jgi:succinoglycan biosynthesis protein ExoV
MKLTYFKGPVPNFGDELNEYMWHKLVPHGFLDEDESELFLGIGSIIWNNLPKTSKKHVMGSGYGGYTDMPNMNDGSWNVVFVRGPRTAALLDIPAEKAIGDSAILLRLLDLPAPQKNLDIAFMPHFHSFDRGFWPEVCNLAGIRLIDPRGDVETILAEVRGAKTLITEAMHGAIVADAVRTPWVAAKPIHVENQMKWLDWAESLNIALRPHDLAPSSLLEAHLRFSKTRKNHGQRAFRLNKSTLVKPLNQILTHLAARKLQKLTAVEPQLSKDSDISRATEKASDALNRFVAGRN